MICLELLDKSQSYWAGNHAPAHLHQNTDNAQCALAQSLPLSYQRVLTCLAQEGALHNHVLQREVTSITNDGTLRTAIPTII